ncbi:MAG: YdcF family protein [Lacisediminimonas sp.]|nr:YdcF family protein [Lacisediminimonas sp.]
MSASVLAIAIISAILLPPLSLLLIAAAGGALLRTRHRFAGRVLVTLSLVLLTVLSTPLTAAWLPRLLESESPPLTRAHEAHAHAIVILGGDRIVAAQEYGGLDQPNGSTLGRLRYGAWLHQQTGLPILVTGGSPDGREEPESLLMARALRDSFKVPVRWEEGRSDNTAQNALNSTGLLKRAGIKRVLLVTDAIHMPRARRIFSAAGLDVVPAPTNIASAPPALTLMAFLPQSGTLERSRYALHEWIGMLWYRVRYQNIDTNYPHTHQQ